MKHMTDLRLDLQHQVEYLQEDIRERTQIFSQGIEDAKKKAVDEYIASSGLDDLMVDSYRWGFKLSRWMIRNTYPELDVSVTSTSHITQEMANAADAEPDWICSIRLCTFRRTLGRERRSFLKASKMPRRRPSMSTSPRRALMT